MFDYLLTNLLNGLIAIVLLLVGYKVFDLITPRINFYDTLRANNYAVAIILATFFIGLSLIISSAAY